MSRSSMPALGPGPATMAASARARRRRTMREHPARFVVATFLAAIAVGTILLLLPMSSAPGMTTSPMTAAFTSTSAVTVTGLSVVDTASHWSLFGKVVILLLVELGGLGFMTIASLIVLLVSRRLGLRQQMVAQAERSALRFGDTTGMLVALARVTFTMQVVVAVVLGLRLWISYDYGAGRAAWYGAFHSVTAFNNAGFALFPDSLAGFRTDWVVLVPIMAAIVVGGLGFPVLVDIDRRILRPERERRRSIRARWDSLALHSKVTLTTTAALFVVGFVLLGAFEWSNPDTLGQLPTADKVLNGAFASVTPRTAGFSTVDTASMQPQSVLTTMVLMFVGAGSAGTSGGIKVGTFGILAMVLWSQLRGERDVTGFRRRIPDATQRQAITVVLLAVALVLGGASVLVASAGEGLSEAAFEAISAFGTVGLTLGVTPRLPDQDLAAVMLLMLVGRVGPITLGAALVLRSSPTRFRVPEEAPLIG